MSGGRPQLNSQDPADRAIAAAVTSYTAQLAYQLNHHGYWPPELRFWAPRDRYEEIGLNAFMAKLEHVLGHTITRLTPRPRIQQDRSPTNQEIEAATRDYAAQLANQLRSLSYWPDVLHLAAPRNHAEQLGLNAFLAKLEHDTRDTKTPVRMFNRPNNNPHHAYRRRWSRSQ